MKSKNFVMAAAQLCASSDVSANLDACKRLAAQAADRGARLFVLPECFSFLGSHERDKFAHAETFGDDGSGGPIRDALRTMAQEHDMWVFGGGTPEIIASEVGTGRVTRTHISCPVFAPTGELAGIYRKVHLFDIDIPGRAVQRESDFNAPGTESVVVETPFARVGLSVCYDLRFPELYRRMTVHGGAEILIVPAAFTVHTGDAHWHVLLRSRAIENQCYVVAAAQTGRHNEHRESYGHSVIIDPWGRVLEELASGEGLVVSEIDMEFLEKTRTQMPCMQHAAFMR